MPEQYSSYKLRTDVLETWLRYTFDDPTIFAESRNGFFVFDLPEGRVLTDDHKRYIATKLKGKRSWKPP
ncbi:hypothetical protein EDB81DRAFT_874119 [Dactylonectria macrodidyma]|uniref:Uncharacterized protein n=1 Tax=Dactylonectria macrodidyma TaxID=307937 RepID=A0A9P9FSM9_9HYPO|nr:hypothetical protein EDB81DRAFT_874119 [Dactylonectria macrodidyma]